MTELLSEAVEVRVGTGAEPVALRLAGRWVRLVRVTGSWLVETDWWRVPVRRHYHRCLLAGGECLEIYQDLESREWRLARRYD